MGSIVELSPWRCPRCHEPLGFTSKRRGGRRTLMIYNGEAIAPHLEISGNATVYCQKLGCDGHRDWQEDAPAR